MNLITADWRVCLLRINSASLQYRYNIRRRLMECGAYRGRCIGTGDFVRLPTVDVTVFRAPQGSKSVGRAYSTAKSHTSLAFRRVGLGGEFSTLQLCI